MAGHTATRTRAAITGLNPSQCHAGCAAAPLSGPALTLADLQGLGADSSPRDVGTGS